MVGPGSLALIYCPPASGTILTFVRVSQATQTKSVPMPRLSSPSRNSSPLLPPAKPKAVLGVPRDFSMRETLKPLPPKSTLQADARKPVSNALNGRIQGIKEDLKALEAEKEAAEKQLSEYNKRIATLDKEAEKIINEYRQQGEAAKEKILTSAKEAAEKIEEQAKRNIENEFEVARQKLRQDIFDQAVARAETLVKGKITSEDQDRLVEEYLDKVVL